MRHVSSPRRRIRKDIDDTVRPIYNALIIGVDELNATLSKIEPAIDYLSEGDGTTPEHLLAMIKAISDASEHVRKAETRLLQAFDIIMENG